uniref:Putative ovule protein n=1 Tax=Solanum chacoense TaxID=4108 RepID=A0A0V0HGI2_SOLCH
MVFVCDILRESWTMQILNLFHVLNLIQQYLPSLSLILWMELHTGDIYHSCLNTYSHLKICRVYHIKLLMYDLLKV